LLHLHSLIQWRIERTDAAMQKSARSAARQYCEITSSLVFPFGKREKLP
jgi:hypothetical protein